MLGKPRRPELHEQVVVREEQIREERAFGGDEREQSPPTHAAPADAADRNAAPAADGTHGFASATCAIARRGQSHDDERDER